MSKDNRYSLQLLKSALTSFFIDMLFIFSYVMKGDFFNNFPNFLKIYLITKNHIIYEDKLETQ